MHRGGRKFKLFSAGSGFTSQIFTGELSGVDSAVVLRQCVFGIYHGFVIIYCDIFFNKSKPKESDKPKVDSKCLAFFMRVKLVRAANIMFV